MLWSSPRSRRQSRRPPPRSVKLSSPSMWISPGERASLTSRPSGGMPATSMTSMDQALKRVDFQGFALICQGLGASSTDHRRSQIGQEGGSRPERPHPEVLGQGRPEVGEGGPDAQLAAGRYPRPPHEEGDVLAG